MDFPNILIITVFGVFHLVGVLVALHSLLHARTPQGSLAWILSFLIIPYLAVPLYFILGPKRFEGYIRARRRRQSPSSPLRSVTNKILSRLEQFKAAPEEKRHRLFTALTKLADFNLSFGNSCKILIDGTNAYTAMDKAVDMAEKYILVSFYIIKNDHVGKSLKDLLIKKAKEGVKVYVIFDEIGSHKLTWGYITELRNSGVNVVSFNGKRSFILNIVRINFRNHRKILIADGKICYIGGVNIGREYIGEGSLGYWRDTVVEIKGPSVIQSQLAFLEDWNWATKQEIPGLNWEPEAHEQNKKIMIIPSGPADKIPAWGTSVVVLANSAKKRLWIASPYFVPDAAVLASMQAAALRGVDVRIIIPEPSDHKMVKFSALTYLRETIPYGIKIMSYTKGFMHQKVLLVDDDIAVIGTANLDNRSLALNFEISVLIHDDETVRQTKEMLQADIDNSRLMTVKEYQDRSLVFRIICCIARLMSPIL